MGQSPQEWIDNKVVGNIAESIVEGMISSIPGWECIKYGMENHIDRLKKTLRNNNKSEVSRKIRCMPDFIVVNEGTKEVLLLDVKYRSFIRKNPGEALHGFGYGQIKDCLEFWPSTHFVIVHTQEPHISVVSVEDIKWHKHFHSRTGEGKSLREQWNFAGISRGIKDLFPGLSEDSLKRAIDRIPGKK